MSVTSHSKRSATTRTSKVAKPKKAAKAKLAVGKRTRVAGR